MSSERYKARGVSSDKKEVHAVVDSMDRGSFPGAFCKVTEDYLTGDPAKCNLIHADGSGTKSILAYLHYRETGDPSVFRGIAQDSIVMNGMICFVQVQQAASYSPVRLIATPEISQVNALQS